MKFWKEHASLRMGIIALFFFVGLALVIYGWTMTGRLSGLGLMIVGVILLLSALMVYNKPFQDERRKL
jgi:hypothetical protein